MDFFDLIILVGAAMVVLPVLAYMIVKFGSAGYYRARQREQEKQQTKDERIVCQ